MSEPIDLGWFCICLNAADVEASAEFYEKLGFREIGETAPKVRISLAHGTDVLTPMNFLKANHINFRGGDIDALATELKSRGFEVRGLNTGPERECGDFTITDPAGNDVFFNTFPRERKAYLDGQRFTFAELATSAGNPTDGEPALGRLLYRLDVKDLAASISFYEKLGLSVLGSADGSVTMGPRNPERRPDHLSFMLRLRQAEESGSTLLFCCESPDQVADSLRVRGLEVVQTPAGPLVTDPDQRSLLLIPADLNPVLA